MRRLFNKRKLLLLFIGVLIVFLSVILIIRVLDNIKTKDGKEEEPSTSIKGETLGFTESYVLDYEEVFCASDNYFYVRDKNSAYLITKDNKILYKEDVEDNYDPYCEIEEKENYIILSSSYLKILLDTNGKIHLNLEEPDSSYINFIEDLITGELYIQTLTYHGEETIAALYDKNLKKIQNIKSSEYPDYNLSDIIDKKIYSQGIIYDLPMNKLGNYETIERITNKLIAVSYKDYVELIDTEKKTNKIYEKMETTKSNLTKFINPNETLIIDYDGNIYENEEKIPLDNGYYLDYSTCKEGSILKDKKDKSLHNDCGFSHDITHIDKGVFSYFSSDLGVYITVTKEGIIESDNSTFIGNYINTSTYDETTSTYLYTIYDLFGKKVYDKYIKYFGNNLYYIDTDNKDYILDENLKIKEEHDSIDCSYEGICLIEDSDKKSIYINGEKILDSNNIISWDMEYNFLKIKSLKGIIFLKYEKNGKFLTKAELEELISIDMSDEYVNKIITTYNLDFKDKINNNKEFFYKYAYLVLNDSDLKGYENYLFNIFEVLVDNKKHLNELYFLSCLKELSFMAKETLDVPEASGTYGENEIGYLMILESADKDRVIYHELLHFIDDCIDEYEYVDIEELNEISTKFFIEGGAELYSSNYFNEGVYESYDKYVISLQGLGIIFGEETINDIFFSNNTDYEFYELLVMENNMSIEEYEKLLIFLNEEYYENIELDIADTLIDLYYLKYKSKWYENKEMKKLISVLLYDKNIEKSKYSSEYKSYTYNLDYTYIDPDYLGYGYSPPKIIQNGYLIAYDKQAPYLKDIITYNPETKEIKVLKKYKLVNDNWEEVN